MVDSALAGYDDVSPRTATTMPANASALLLPILLLIGSNVFMTFAWYGHLKYTDRPLWAVILVSWGIAFFEYCLQVPANRLGYQAYSPAQLKGMQEIITLLVFAGFSIAYLGATIKWNHIAGFVLIVVAAFLIFLD
jgi:hypothetical protein